MAKSKEDCRAELLEYFYSIQYQVNMVIEDAMRGSLSRREAALLWCLYAEGDADASLPRKLIVEKLNAWFDATSSNVTKLIARLESPALGFVKLVNEAGSARDKRVVLTEKGQDLVRNMLATGAAHPIIEHLSEDIVRAGLKFFQQAHVSSLNALPLKKLKLERSRQKS